MTPDPAAVASLIHRLRYLHDGLGFSYQAIRETYYPSIPRGTLGRIAKGKYFPKNRKELRALGFGKPDEATEYVRLWKRTFTRLLKELKVK